MASAGKRFGGVKQRRQGETPAVRASDSAPSRTFGGVKAPVPRGARGSGVESCPQNCPGEWIAGMWIHSRDCPWASVLWKAHGATVKQWRCPYDCDPVELPSGWTHPYDCPFWDHTGRTPFDHNPPHDVPIHHLDSAVLPRRMSRAEKREAAQQANAAYRATFDDFPEALKDEDNDLPF